MDRCLMWGRRPDAYITIHCSSSSSISTRQRVSPKATTATAQRSPPHTGRTTLPRLPPLEGCDWAHTSSSRSTVDSCMESTFSSHLNAIPISLVLVSIQFPCRYPPRSSSATNVPRHNADFQIETEYQMEIVIKHLNYINSVAYTHYIELAIVQFKSPV